MSRLLVLTMLALPVAAGCAGTPIPGASPAPKAAAPAAAPAHPRVALRAAIDSLLDAPRFRNAFWGVLVVDPARGDTLYSRNADKLFLPASNEKIITGAVALARLGPEYRWRTTFAARGAVRKGVLRGDLVVAGRGDPTVSDTMRGQALAPLLAVADSLAARGIRRITGRVVAGGDAFPGPVYGAGWSWDDLSEDYGAGVDELLFNDGFTEITVRAGARAGDPLVSTTRPLAHYPPVRLAARTAEARPAGTIPDSLAARVSLAHAGDTLVVSGTLYPGESWVATASYAQPAGAYLAALSDALTSRHVRVDGRRSADSTARADTLFAMQSPPLRDVLRAMEKPSQNQLAEVIFRTLALEGVGVGDADSARRIVRDQLLAWGAAPDGFELRDGSGLSRLDRVSPATIVRVLDAVRRDTAFATFLGALPVAGVDGTLERRLRDTPAQGVVHAKTGTLDGVSSLSGYVATPGGGLLLFSILSNNWTTRAAAARETQDAIVQRLVAFPALR